MLTLIGLGGSASNIVKKFNRKDYEIILTSCDNFDKPSAGCKCIIYKNLYYSEFNDDLENGEYVIESIKEDIINSIHNDYVIIISCVGSRISGGLPYLVTLLEKIGKKVCVVVQSPLKFEGEKKLKNYDYVINKLKDVTNNIICLDSQVLFESVDKGTPISEFFQLLDEELLKMIRNEIRNDVHIQRGSTS